MADEYLVPVVECPRPTWERRFELLPMKWIPANEPATKFVDWCNRGITSTLVTNMESGHTVSSTGLFPRALPWEGDLWITFMPQICPSAPFHVASYSPALMLS